MQTMRVVLSSRMHWCNNKLLRSCRASPVLKELGFIPSILCQKSLTKIFAFIQAASAAARKACRSLIRSNLALYCRCLHVTQASGAGGPQTATGDASQGKYVEAMVERCHAAATLQQQQQPHKGLASNAYAPQPSSPPTSSFPFQVISSSRPSCLLPSSQTRCLSYHTMVFLLIATRQ
jgi:hypothetical protein